MEPTRALGKGDVLAPVIVFDSGDHSHPNDAGYKAMAMAIDLGLLTRGK